MIIPAHINANALIPFIEELAGFNSTDRVELDFSDLRRVSPAGLVAIASFCNWRKSRGLHTDVVNLSDCSIKGYLDRMNLFSLCEWDGGVDGYHCKDSTGRFVPLTEISACVDKMSHEVAQCIAPGGEEFEHENADLYDTAWYLISELATNVRQHSRKRGYIAAQSTNFDGHVRIALSDYGCGIPSSLKGSYPAWVNYPDFEVIVNALKAHVSSVGEPSNQGVGLTLAARLVDLMEGHLLIISKKGLIRKIHGSPIEKRELNNGNEFPGTIIAITFRKSHSTGYHDKLQKAKELENLLPKSNLKASFE
jgi:anti-sigma regulatory factor (Ser/Thr protein kinase)/ABC-type transporter Mla MlaB component